MWRNNDSKAKRAAVWVADRLSGAILTSLVAVWVAYTVYPEFRASVWRLVDGVGEGLPVAVALFGLGGAGYLVWRTKDRLWSVVKWWGGKLRAGYLWVVWTLAVRPARDYLGVEASNEAFDPAAEFTEELRPVVRDLDYESLALLGRALDRRKPGSREAVMEWPELPLEPDAAEWPEDVTPLFDACERLREAGAVEVWVAARDRSDRFLELKIRFPVSAWAALERLGVWVKVELAKREMQEELQRALQARAATGVETGGADQAIAEGGCREAVANLKVPPLLVLYVALQKYEESGSDPVRVGMSDLQALWGGTSEKLSPRVVRDACRRLKWTGFIKKHSVFEGKGGSGVSVPLADCLKEPAAARRVREWCSDGLVERGVWDF